MLGRFSLLLVLAFPMAAQAMPDVVVAVGTVVSLIPGWNWVGYALIVVGTIWGGEEAKRAQKEKEDDAKRKYNASLEDRKATVIASDSPHRYIYGLARVGSAIVAVLSSGSRDEYKHLVCIHAAHECDAIEEIYINGKALGTLDGSGYVTGGDYYTETSTEYQETFTGTGTTLVHTPLAGTTRVLYWVEGYDAWHPSHWEPVSFTLDGAVISGVTSRTYRVNYSYNTATSGLRALKHLGATTQVADATLISELPLLWDNTKTLSGMCYTIITLNLNFTDFQGGCPTVEALIRGKKLHDPRDGAYPNDTPVWSQNNALMIADYLTSEMCSVPWTDLPLADFQTAANVCAPITGCTYSQSGTTVTVTKTAHGLAVGDTREMVVLTGLGVAAAIDISYPSPAVVTLASHGFAAGQPFKFNSTGFLPKTTPRGQIFYVISAGLTTDTFRFSATLGGEAISSIGNQNGIHRLESVAHGHFKVTAATANTFTYTTLASQTTSGNLTIGGLYTANGTVNADDSQSQVIEKMAQSMAGTVCATTWGVRAGAYTATVMNLDQSDIVGDMSYTAGTAEADLYNGVKGQYIDPNNLYVATDFVPYQNASYVTEDGDELWTDVSFMFTDDLPRVHNICRIFTEDQRNGFTVSANFSYKTWALQIGDRVAFTSTLMGQTDKVYRLIKKSYAPDASVSITMKEDADSIWDTTDAPVGDATPNTYLPSPFTVPVPGAISVTEELYETTGSAGVKIKAIVTWLAPADVNVLDYEILYKPYAEALYNLKIYAVGEYVELLDLHDGQYDIKIRARNNLNFYSDYTPVHTFTLYGLAPIPGNVQNFTIKPFNGSAICSWDKTVDLDVKIGGDVEIRYCPVTTGQSWEQSYVIPDGDHNGDATTAVVSLATGTYYAKFIDSIGQYSAVEASFIVTEALLTGWTTVTTTTQDPTFVGSKTNLFVDNNALKLSSVSLWDDMYYMDDWGFLDTLGGVASEGTYLFDATVDLGTIASRRFHLTMQALSVSVVDTVDARLDNIDTWASFDGDIINGTNATVYASVSEDNVVYSAWAPFMVADFKCRYAKFKAVLTSNEQNNNIEVSQLRVAIKIPA